MKIVTLRGFPGNSKTRGVGAALAGFALVASIGFAQISNAPPASCTSTQHLILSGAPPGWKPIAAPDEPDRITKASKPRVVDDGLPIVIPLQIARIANDDGSRQTHITPAEAQTWINYANIVFSPAQITFTFDPLSSFSTIRSTLVNGMTGVEDVNWDAERAAANHVAASYPGRMTMIARWGPSSGPTGGGFAWWDYNYVTIPGFNDTGICGEQNIKLFAHEIGHHMGMPHTFWAIFDTVAQAEADFATRGNDPNAYDGDGIADTPPHPTIGEQGCVTPNSFLLNGVTIFNARSNIMSYFFDAVTISTQQVQRVRWMALNYIRGGMLGPSNKGVSGVAEAEGLTFVGATSTTRSTQGMAVFGVDGWSADQQVFMSFNTASANITYSITAPTTGQYRVELYATQAPDYGNVQCAIDGVNIGTNVDGYAPLVLPTGAIVLGTRNLTAGNHNFRMTRNGKSALSTGFLFGFDAIRLVNVTNIEQPVIQVQPLSQIVDAGAMVNLHSVVAGGGLQYQWRKNGVNIPGATVADLPLNPAIITDTATYSVAVTNSAGFVISSNATLTINAAPIPAQWTGASAVNKLWSNTNNWAPTRLPGIYTQVTFDNTIGFTNAPGAVSSVVNSNFTVQQLSFDARAPNYHTLKLNTGVTLKANNPGVTDSPLGISALTGNTEQEYVTILGTNASLVAGDTNAPVVQPSITSSDPGTALDIALRSATGGNQLATLDMSGLDNFSFGGGYVRIGGSSSGSASQASARATLLLAKTNHLYAGNAYNTALNIGGVMAGYRSANLTATDWGEIRLGVMNRILTDYVKIGGNRSSTGMMAFQTSALLSNPQLILRNTNGTGRVSFVEIGDSSRQTGNANETAYGAVDLSGGTVSALVGTLSVGRSLTTTATATARGHGNGILTWTAGTIDASTVNIGTQGGNNNGLATGAVNVRSNALLLAGTINLGGDAGNNATGTGSGILNVDGGTVNVINLLESNGSGGNSSSLVLVTNGGRINATGGISVDSVILGNGTVTNGGSLTVRELRGNGVIRGLVNVVSGGTFSPGASIGTITVSNNLVLAGGCTSIFEVNLDTLACDTAVGMNNVVYGGTLIVTNIGGVTARTNGATLKLFSAAGSYQNVFTTISLPPPGAGLQWITTGLTNGTLQLQSTISTTPTPMAFQVTGNLLEISWPADHTGWRLESQTNSMDVGLSNNWFTVAGSTATNRLFFPLSQQSGAVFYRLTYP